MNEIPKALEEMLASLTPEQRQQVLARLQGNNTAQNGQEGNVEIAQRPEHPLDDTSPEFWAEMDRRLADPTPPISIQEFERRMGWKSILEELD